MSIRPYVQGQDDKTLLHICNTARSEAPDFVPARLEQFRTGQRSPNWTPEGRFFAELDGEPVGYAMGYVDKRGTDGVGDLRGPNLLPGSRRRGVGTALARKAMDYLRRKGMERARVWVEGWNHGGRAFLDSLGFEQVRQYSIMRRPLSGLPSGIGENEEAVIEELGGSREDVALQAAISNAAFQEHFGHRDVTEEELMFWVRNTKRMGYVVRRTVARVNGEPVGYLIHGYDPRGNRKLGVERGGLWSVGVLKEYRCRGVATRLMLEGMEWLVAQGMDEVELGVDDENVTRARRVYERLGFKEVHTDMACERPLDPLPREQGGGMKDEG